MILLLCELVHFENIICTVYYSNTVLHCMYIYSRSQKKWTEVSLNLVTSYTEVT